MKIDTDAKQFSPEDALQLFEVIYQIYHNRRSDVDGQRDLLPILERYGFLGLARVLRVVTNSDEMTRRVTEELDHLWQQHFQRRPTDEEKDRYSPVLRYYREAGRQEIESKMRRAIEVQKQASELAKEGNPTQAQTLIEAAMDEIIPGWWLFWHDYGLSLLRQGKYQQAIPHYEQAIAYNEDDSSWAWSCDDLRHCYEKLGHNNKQWYRTGTEYFRSLTERRPQRWSAWHCFAWLTWQSGKPSDAILLYQRAISLNADDCWRESCENLRQCYEEIGQHQQAHEYYSWLAHERPKLWAAWHSRALLERWMNGPSELALKFSETAIQNHPEGGWFWSWCDKGDCLLDLGRPQEALAAFEKAKEADPDNEHAWSGIARTWEQLGNWKLAAENYRQAHLRAPERGDLLLSLGRCYRSQRPILNTHCWIAYRTVLQRAIHSEKVKAEQKQEAQAAIDELREKNQPRIELSELLDQSLDLEQLQVMCWELGDNFESLGSGGPKLRIIKLVGRFIRNDQSDMGDRPDRLIEWMIKKGILTADVFPSAQDTKLVLSASASGLSVQNRASLQRQLAESYTSLQLIEERRAEFVQETDIPLTLIKDERRLRQRIIEIEARLSE